MLAAAGMGILHWPPARGAEAEALAARPFGAEPGDLSVDFAAPADEALTDLLTACLTDAAGTRYSREEIDGWSVKKRRQALIAVAVATSGPERAVTARCADRACGTVLEIPLDLGCFRMDWRNEHIPLDVDGTVVDLRPPRPADLAVWAGQSEALDAAALAARLVVSAEPPAAEAWGAAAETALAEDDRLADLVLEAGCPECGAAVGVPLVLETLLMRGLAGTAAALLDEVHVLASAYHWSEAAILALPPGRRAHYLACISEDWS